MGILGGHEWFTIDMPERYAEKVDIKNLPCNVLSESA